MAVQLSMAQAFSRYDSLGSGGLTSTDIEAFLHAADFDADAAYVAEIMQLWDSDHSGLVEWGEFCELWAHLGLGDTAADAIQLVQYTCVWDFALTLGTVVEKRTVLADLGGACVDELTSVADRRVARTGARAVAAFARARVNPYVIRV